MSQAKVDRYKESKKHRKEEVRKAKRNRMLAKIIVPICCIAVIAWIAYSGYAYYQAQQPATYIDVNLSGITDYLGTL